MDIKLGIAHDLLPVCELYLILALKIGELVQAPDISQVMVEIDHLLDRSIAVEGDDINTHLILDPNQLDLEKRSARLQKSREQQKRLEAVRPRSLIEGKLKQLIAVNRIRMDLVIKFQNIIEENNAKGSTIDEFFRKLVEFSHELNEDEKRAIRQNLSEVELSLLEMLTKPDIHMSQKKADKVKKSCTIDTQSFKAGKTQDGLEEKTADPCRCQVVH